MEEKQFIKEILKKIQLADPIAFCGFASEYPICFQEKISYSSMLPSEWRKRLSFKTGSSIGQTRDVQKQLAIDYVQMIMGYDVDCDDTAEALCLGVVFTSQYVGVGND